MFNFSHPLVKLVLAGIATSALIGGTVFGTLHFTDKQVKDVSTIFGSNAKDAQTHFMSLDKFVISLNGEERPHYLLLELDLKTSSLTAHEELIRYRPVVNNVLLKMFSQYSYEEMRDINDIDYMQKQVQMNLAKTLLENGFMYNIDDVLFTKLVLQ
ncbi:flagellar basal body-associated FliL family protein [Vibrio sp. ZSDE26]|uniref:Flagellar protein FliL n=1 Tax=Vibrio amylolyticus TaxID=2847292 RepID=A0A9X1XHY5_9VIBR|nr:flagellar basal body-associated FliL family protein [Vibrio amylolyticus]MCK6263342.1 flagellar basal body-associated FliL family protein [Vibrio amylolyticus]